MKLLVVLFALTAATGGQAMTIREAPGSEPKLRGLSDKIFQLGIDVFLAVSGKYVKRIESSNITAINEQLDKMAEKVRDQGRELPPEMREVKEIVTSLSRAYKAKTSQAFHQWSNRHYEEIKAVMDALALYIDPGASKALWCMEWIEQNVAPTVIEMYELFGRHLNQALESLGSTLSSYTKEQQEIGESLQALVDKAAKRLRLGMETLNKHLKPYWIPFLEEYKKYDPALREWMESPLFPPPKED